MKRTILMVGGPLDGQRVPDTGDFREGDIEAVDTRDRTKQGAQWSKESVYRVTGGRLVYDSALTRKRRLLTSIRGSSV